jgi:predicted phosphate transport protein (TIGR00153 family)
MREVEHQNDLVTHKIFDQLHKTFITPFDREDIHQLAAAADDVLDYLCSAVERCDILGVDDLTSHMKEQIRILAKSMHLIAKILDSLSQLKERTATFAAQITEIHTLENDGDATYMRALKSLFADASDPIHVIRWNDLYRTVERAIDRCERLADVTEGISIKHA